jgi:hypothetical protein
MLFEELNLSSVEHKWIEYHVAESFQYSTAPGAYPGDFCPDLDPTLQLVWVQIRIHAHKNFVQTFSKTIFFLKITFKHYL